jgi:hypothetical protein
MRMAGATCYYHNCVMVIEIIIYWLCHTNISHSLKDWYKYCAHQEVTAYLLQNNKYCGIL